LQIFPIRIKFAHTKMLEIYGYYLKVSWTAKNSMERLCFWMRLCSVSALVNYGGE